VARSRLSHASGILIRRTTIQVSLRLEAVLHSIAATEDYFKPAELAVEEGQLLLSDHILGPDNPDPLERFLFGQLRLRPLLEGLYVGNPAGESIRQARGRTRVSPRTTASIIS
jgi:hypothetical protein